MQIKTGDTVQVIAGDYKGKVGKVLGVMPKTNRLIVEDVNMQTKHNKPQGMNQPGGIAKREGPIDASDVLLYDEAVKKGVRVRTIVENGKKIRVSTKSDTRFDK